MADRVGRRARRAARDAAGARHRCASHRQPGRAGLLQLLPLRRCRQQRGRPAARGDAARGLADHARRRCAQAAGRRRARRRPPRFLRRRAADAARPSAGRAQARRSGGPAAGRVGQRDRRHRAPHLAGAGRGDPHAERRGSARLLRRHRAHRAPREHRSVDRLEAVALRQGRPGRRRRRLSQLPAEQGGVRRLRRGPAGGRQDRVQGVGAQHALLQRLPADRGDRRQRTADTSLRADEAGRPARSAHRPSPVGRRAAAPGQCARHACGTSWASRPS